MHLLNLFLELHLVVILLVFSGYIASCLFRCFLWFTLFNGFHLLRLS